MEWEQAREMSGREWVDAAIRNLIADPTEDNAVCLVRLVAEAGAEALARAVLDIARCEHESNYRKLVLIEGLAAEVILHG